MNKEHCRLCLAELMQAYSLLDNKFANMLESLTSIKVSSDDIYSTVSCFKCISDLNIAFNIQQNILKNDEKLRDEFENIVEIKQEILDENNIWEVEETKLVPITTREDVLDDEKLTFNVQENILKDDDKDGDELVNIVEIKQETLDDKNICQIEATQLVHTPTASDMLNDTKLTFDMQQNLLGANDLLLKNNKAGQEDVSNAANNSFDSENVISIVKCDNEDGHVVDEDMQTDMFSTKENCIHCKQIFKDGFKNNSDIKLNLSACHNCRKKSNDEHIETDWFEEEVLPDCLDEGDKITSPQPKMRIPALALLKPQKGFQCSVCDKIFNTQTLYDNHSCLEETSPILRARLFRRNLKHKIDHPCEICGKVFSYYSHLEDHINRIHLQLRPHQCQFCGKTFKTVSCKSVHERQHTKETPYKCEVCGRRFKRRILLRRHKELQHNIVEPNNCECPICGQMFISRCAVASHMRCHS